MIALIVQRPIHDPQVRCSTVDFIRKHATCNNSVIRYVKKFVYIYMYGKYEGT